MFLFEWIDNFSSVKPSDPCADYWPVETRDYSYLFGKKFNYHHKDGSIDKGEVHLIDYPIGLTTANAFDKDDKLTCLSSPGSNNKHKTKNYKEYFLAAIKMIEEGNYYQTTAMNIVPPNFGGMNSCAFGG